MKIHISIFVLLADIMKQKIISLLSSNLLTKILTKHIANVVIPKLSLTSILNSQAIMMVKLIQATVIAEPK